MLDGKCGLGGYINVLTVTCGTDHKASLWPWVCLAQPLPSQSVLAVNEEELAAAGALVMLVIVVGISISISSKTGFQVGLNPKFYTYILKWAPQAPKPQL